MYVQVLEQENRCLNQIRVSPVNHDNGVWTFGMLYERVATSWVQIEMEKSNYRVESGFSGAPVWDEELNAVVGMIVASERRQDIKAAFMLPTTVLVEACHLIKPAPPIPIRSEERRVGKEC